MITAAGCGGGSHATTSSTAPASLAAAATGGTASTPAPARRIAKLRLPATLPARTLQIPVLMYHRIDVMDPSLPAVTRGLTVSRADFAAQMRWLKAHGYTGISERQLYAGLIEGRPLPKRPVMVTFDDGYADIVAAARVLHGLRWPGTAYLITDRLSAVPGFLTWPEVHQLEALGMDIGSHTVSHLDLTTLDPAALRTQLVRSKGILERRLHHPVQWFCYPAGAYDDQVVTAVRAAGYVLATTTDPGLVQDAQHPLRLHRVRVLDSTGPSLAGLVPG